MENDENVVKPPQIPTVRKSLTSDERKSPFSAKPKISPINKLPRMFTENVAQGKKDAELSWMKRERVYRRAVPIKPPTLAIITDFTIKTIAFKFMVEVISPT